MKLIIRNYNPQANRHDVKLIDSCGRDWLHRQHVKYVSSSANILSRPLGNGLSLEPGRRVTEAVDEDAELQMADGTIISLAGSGFEVVWEEGPTLYHRPGGLTERCIWWVKSDGTLDDSVVSTEQFAENECRITREEVVTCVKSIMLDKDEPAPGEDGWKG